MHAREEDKIGSIAQTSMRQAWQAQDFVRGHLDESLPVMRLCKELRVSRRQLEYAFRTAFEVSPQEFIQLARLNESRRLLLNARKRDLTVTDIAMEVGVNHLGRFSTADWLRGGDEAMPTDLA